MATEQQVREFINKVAPLVQKYAKEYGYKVASPIIAQACLESGYGLSSLSSVYNNHFGMKCGSAWQGKSVNMATKEEYQAGVITNIRDNFRVYDTFEAGVKGYFDFISTTRYANLKNADSAETYLATIKADGYATSNSYVANNMAIVLKYNLTEYDKMDTPVITPAVDIDALARDVINGKYGDGAERKAKLGDLYNEVQARVNELVSAQPTYREYKVIKGDTLSKIAKKLLGDAKRYPEIATLNGIKDPNKIRVGQVLKMPN